MKGQGAFAAKDVYVARVHVNFADQRHFYEFWNGKSWDGNVRKCATIIRDMQHGQVFQSKMFGEGQPYTWVFIGCNAQGDNKVQMGRAMSPEGPCKFVRLRGSPDQVSLARWETFTPNTLNRYKG